MSALWITHCIVTDHDAYGQYARLAKEVIHAHGGEFLRAKAAGLVGDDHIAAEIGEVLAGARPGRTAAGEITLYKSLGHAAQDLAAAAWLYQDATGKTL